MNEKQSWNISTLFLVLIFGFTIATFLKPDSGFSESENRALTRKPSFSFESLISGEYMKKYEDYLTDQFFLRDEWISLKTGAERAALRQETKDIYFAEDDYLIEKHTGTFEADQASANINYLKTFSEQMRERYGAEHYTVMIVPNAVDILSEKLPSFASPYDEEDYLSQIQSTLPEGCWFDSSAVLRSHDQEEIYYRTDHHWETLGAFYVFSEWARAKNYADEIRAEDYNVITAADNFEGTIASKTGGNAIKDTIEIYVPKDSHSLRLTYNQTDEVYYSIYRYNALEGKDKYSYFYGGNYGLIEGYVYGADTGRKLLIIKDSYAHCFVPFTYEYFDEVDMLDLRYFNQSLSEFMEKKEYTDVLFLQNAAGFAEDTSLIKLTF